MAKIDGMLKQAEEEETSSTKKAGSTQSLKIYLVCLYKVIFESLLALLKDRGICGIFSRK